MTRHLVTFSLADVKPLPRPALMTGRGGQQYYRNGDQYQAYKAALRLACADQLPDDWVRLENVAIGIDMVVQFDEAGRAKVRSKEEWHLVTPDSENLLKPVQDSLTGLVFRDDRVVCQQRIAKVWGPGHLVVVRLELLDAEDLTSVRDRQLEWVW